MQQQILIKPFGTISDFMDCSSTGIELYNTLVYHQPPSYLLILESYLNKGLFSSRLFVSFHHVWVSAQRHTFRELYQYSCLLQDCESVHEQVTMNCLPWETGSQSEATLH